MGDLQNGCRQVQKGIGAGMVRAGIVVNKVAESWESEMGVRITSCSFVTPFASRI